MEMEKIIYLLANKFEKVRIKSNTLKVIYFLCRHILSVWFISLFVLIPCKLFQKSEIRQKIIDNSVNLLKQNQIFGIISLLLALIAIVSLPYLIYQVQNEVLLKICLVSFLLMEILINVANAFLLILITSQQLPIIIKIISLIIFIIFHVLTFIQNKIFISFSFESSNQFAHSNNDVNFLAISIEKFLFYIILLVMAFQLDSVFLGKIYYPAIMILQIMKLVSNLNNKYYIDQISNNLQIFGHIVALIALILSQIDQIATIHLLERNFYPLWVIITVFAILSAYYYLSSTVNEYLFQTIEEAVQKKKLIKFLEACFYLWKNSQTTYNSLMVASIRKNHQYSCRKLKCYCHSAKEIQQKSNTLQGNQVFFKGYFQQHLNYIQKQNKKGDSVFLKVLNFKFTIFNNYIGVSRQLNTIRYSFFQNIQICIGASLLEQSIESFIDESNNRHDNVNVELPIILNEKIQEMERIIFDDIHTKSKKWNNLSKNLCKSFDIEGEIAKQIANLREFDKILNQNQSLYKKSLAFNALCMFYYGDVAFLNRQLDKIQSNLRQLRTVIKHHEIVNNKQLSKNIFDSRSCFLQFDLSKNESMQNLQLPIINCSDNIKQIFKYNNKNLLIDEKIEILFPKFLWNQYKSFILKVLNQSEEQQCNQARDKYFVDKMGYVFQALATFKMLPKPNGIALMLLLFQKQTKNIVLLNQKGNIQNVGQTFINYFGRVYDGVPLLSYFYFDDQFESMKFTQKGSKNKFLLIDGSELGNDWTNYLQSIRSHIRKNKIYQNSNNKQSKQAQNSKCFKNKMYSLEVHQFLRKEKRQLIRSKILTSKTLTAIKDSNFYSNRTISILSVTLDYRSNQINDFVYFPVVFDQIKRKKSPNSQTQYTLGSFCQDGPKRIVQKAGRQYEGTLKNLEKQEQQAEDQKILLEQLQNQEEALNSIDLEEELRKRQQQKQLIYHDASSVQSSLNTGSVSFFYYKFIEICFNLFKNPRNISDVRLNTFTISSILMSMLISSLVIGTYTIFDLGLYEVKDIFFADGAVSDNMQLVQFMYNRAMNFKQFKDNETELKSIMRSAYYERQYVFNLTVYDLQQYLTDETSMTKTKFYEYIRLPITWTFGDNRLPIEIQTNQFLNYYYHLSRQVQLNILNTTKQAQDSVENAFQVMRINFPELKRINHENLYLYQRMSDDSLLLLRKLIVILGISHAFLLIIAFFLYYKEKIFRRNQLMEGFSIYKLIPQRIIQIISSYYDGYCQQIKEQKDLIKFQTHYQRKFLYLPIDQNIFVKPNRNIFITSHSFFTASIWKALIAIILLNVTFATMLIKINNLFNPIQLMMKNVNNLMDSQNWLLEAYFDLKAKFIIEENFNVDPAFFDDLLQSQLSNDVIFNKISVQSLDLFAEYDQAYKSDFIDLLITNNCDLAQDFILPWQYQKCKTYFKLYFLQNGVITSMNFFTRRTRQLINQLKQKYIRLLKDHQTISQNDKQGILLTLKSLDFREIDESIIYMFKMYQGTQARIYQSLQKTIIDIMNFSFWIIGLELLVVSILYPILIYFNFNWEKVQLSHLYVSFLLIPSPLAKLLKTFSGKIQQILQYDKAQ